MNKRAIPAINLLLLGLALAAWGQVQVGDSVKMNLNGVISGGYTADYGNVSVSNHGFTAGGTADLSGSYYNPNFVSFHIQPYYNQARANSNFQSITDATGVNANAAIFSGSNFPGTVSYSRNYNSEGTFGLPGVADYTTHGNGDAFSIGWGEYIPDKPHVSVSFIEGNNHYSIFGINQESASHFNSFSAAVSHVMAGFKLNGNFQHSDNQLQLPQIVVGEPAQNSGGGSNSFGFGASHTLPLNGSFSAGASRSYAYSSFRGGSFDGTIDNVNGGVGFHPGNLSFGINTQYTDNLAGTLLETILGAGGTIPTNVQQSSHSLDINNYASYALPQYHVTFYGSVEHRQQSLFGGSLSANSYTGTVNYANALLGGFVNAVFGVVENTIDIDNQSMLGLVGSGSYSRRVGRWILSGGFNYAQNQQTLLVAYTTSSYGYTGSIGRKLGTYSYFNLNATASKSGLTGIAGTSSFSQSYTASVSLTHWISASGSYSKSDGNSILTGTGLVPTPVPVPIVTPTSVILYGGHAYSVGLGSSPKRGLTLSASFAKALSNTSTPWTFSNNQNEIFTARVQYQVRQMYFQAGYSRLVQGFSLTGQPPTMLGSMYVGISRWFNFF